MLDFSLCSIRFLRVSPVKKLDPPESIRYVVGLGRIELPTSRLSGVRSNHLSYRPFGPFVGDRFEICPHATESGVLKEAALD